MSLPRLIVAVALIGAAAHFWTKHRDAQELIAATNTNGFVPIPMPDGAVRNQVLVFAPVGCPREGARRARALAQSLTDRGIDNALTAHYSVAAMEPGPEADAVIRRLNAVMNGELPIVLVNGMGKANPTMTDVVAELESTRRR